MATYAYTLKVNFTNYKPESTEPTVSGASAAGINIFKQQFKRDKTTAGTSAPMEDGDIFDLIKGMLVCKKQTTESGTSTEAEQTTSIKIITHTNTDVFSGLVGDPIYGLTQNTDGTYKLKPGFGIVFKVKQGEQEHQYYTYYCYFKEKLSFDNSANPNENLWSMFITSKDRQPLLFDVQDERDVIITLSGTSIKTIDTTNFVLSSDNNGYKTTDYELKNTAFNLSVDDKSEYTAEVTPMFCFQYNDA